MNTKVLQYLRNLKISMSASVRAAWVSYSHFVYYVLWMPGFKGGRNMCHKTRKSDRAADRHPTRKRKNNFSTQSCRSCTENVDAKCCHLKSILSTHTSLSKQCYSLLFRDELAGPTRFTGRFWFSLAAILDLIPANLSLLEAIRTFCIRSSHWVYPNSCIYFTSTAKTPQTPCRRMPRSLAVADIDLPSSVHVESNVYRVLSQCPCWIQQPSLGLVYAETELRL